MTKTKVILLVSFLVTFAAGAALGVLAGRPGHGKSHGSLKELNLTHDQEAQMKKIWSDDMGLYFKQQGERRAALVQKRDQDVMTLLTEAQRPKYQAIQQEYSGGQEALSQDRRRAFDDAVKRTKEILTPEQAAKYDELMKQRDRGMDEVTLGLRGSRRHHTAPSSQPTTVEQPPHGGE